MTYSAIDGDISDFFDWMTEVTHEFRTDELRNFLLNEGHSLEETIGAVVRWQEDRFEALDPAWERFRLTAAGRTAVRRLQDTSTKS